MFAIRGADAAPNVFVREEVDLLDEHQRQTGRAAAEPLALAIMTDSDGLCANAVAWYGDFQLLPPAPRTAAELPAS